MDNFETVLQSFRQEIKAEIKKKRWESVRQAVCWTMLWLVFCICAVCTVGLTVLIAVFNAVFTFVSAIAVFVWFLSMESLYWTMLGLVFCICAVYAVCTVDPTVLNAVFTFVSAIAVFACFLEKSVRQVVFWMMPWLAFCIYDIYAVCTVDPTVLNAVFTFASAIAVIAVFYWFLWSITIEETEKDVHKEQFLSFVQLQDTKRGNYGVDSLFGRYFAEYPYYNEKVNLALDYYKRVLELEPAGENRVICLNNIAELYSKLRKYELAIDYYEKVLELEPAGDNRVRCLHNIADMFRNLSKYELALDYYEKALECSNKLLAMDTDWDYDEELRLERLRLYLDTDRLQEFAEDMDDVEELCTYHCHKSSDDYVEPEFTKLKGEYEKRLLYRSLRNDKDTLPYLKELTPLDYEQAKGWRMLCEILTAGNPQEVLRCLNKAVAMFPNNKELRLERLQFYLDTDRLQEFAEDMDAVEKFCVYNYHKSFPAPYDIVVLEFTKLKSEYKKRLTKRLIKRLRKKFNRRKRLRKKFSRRF